MKLITEMSQDEILTTFYIFGAIIMLGVGIANSISNYINWDLMLLSFKFSSVLSNLFNYLIAWFFYSMLRNKKREERFFNNLQEKQAEEIIGDLEK